MRLLHLLAFALVLAVAPAVSGTATARAQERLPVVATFSILGDMVGEVGGDRIALTTLVGPDGDGHVYQPSPADAKAVAGAKVVFVNGLNFEGWIDRLVKASGYAGTVSVASRGVHAIETDETHERVHEPGRDHRHDHDHAHESDRHHDQGHHDQGHDDHGHAESGHDDGHDHGALDPHAWQDLANARVYVANIRDALTAADPGGAATYAANADRYLGEIDALDTEIRTALGSLPAERRRIVTTHDAFGYFARAYDVTFLAPVGVSTEAEASAKDVAALIRQIRKEDISAVFVENVSDPRLIEQITRETDAKVGGTLYSDALSPPEGPAPTYLAMMRHNLRALMGALSS